VWNNEHWSRKYDFIWVGGVSFLGNEKLTVTQECNGTKAKGTRPLPTQVNSAKSSNNTREGRCTREIVSNDRGKDKHCGTKKGAQTIETKGKTNGELGTGSEPPSAQTTEALFVEVVKKRRVFDWNDSCVLFQHKATGLRQVCYNRKRKPTWGR